jgi:transposase
MNPNRESHGVLSQEELIALVAAQAAEVARQAAEIAALKAQLAELERRLALNSSNSGKPPSSDGLNKPARPHRTTSLREASNKPSGGQKGHRGETLEQVAAPDHTVDHFAPSCAACGAALTIVMSTGHRARQVFDLPQPTPLVVTEHRAHDCVAALAERRPGARFPTASLRRCNMARASPPSSPICCTINCCRRIAWPN